MEKQPQHLEELIQRELSKLPERTAPGSLIPRVLLEIQARQQKHWWQRPWGQWPFVLQIASLPFLLGGAAGAMMLVASLWKAASGRVSLEPVWETADFVAGLWDVVLVLGNAALLLVQSAGQMWLWAAVLVPIFMYLACIGLGTLCYRMAISRR